MGTGYGEWHFLQGQTTLQFYFTISDKYFCTLTFHNNKPGSEFCMGGKSGGKFVMGVYILKAVNIFPILG